MFLDFFLLLKNDGIPVTIREYLTFLEALDKDVVEYSVDDFYFLSRTSLIKHEHHLDRFDLLFGYFFEGIEKRSGRVRKPLRVKTARRKGRSGRR